MSSLLVVCHDAGGAEVVSSWVRHNFNQWSSVMYALDGPAAEIFPRKAPELRDFLWSRQLEFFDIAAQDLVLCGSSGTSALERTAVTAARRLGVPSVVFLDHWKWYKERFDHLPNEVWVSDAYALALAQGELPDANVIQVRNYWQEDFVQEVKCLGPHYRSIVCDEREHILLVHDRDCGIETFRRYLAMVDFHRVVFRDRHHPASTQNHRRSGRTLAEDVAWADTVVGADSMALALALAAGRRVISVLPASDASLPFPEIERPCSTRSTDRRTGR